VLLSINPVSNATHKQAQTNKCHTQTSTNKQMPHTNSKLAATTLPSSTMWHQCYVACRVLQQQQQLPNGYQATVLATSAGRMMSAQKAVKLPHKHVAVSSHNSPTPQDSNQVRAKPPVSLKPPTPMVADGEHSLIRPGWPWAEAQVSRLANNLAGIRPSSHQTSHTCPTPWCGSSTCGLRRCPENHHN